MNLVPSGNFVFKPFIFHSKCCSQERNIIEAASKGATLSVKLIANIAVNLIAFIAMLQFVDATLIWFGNRAGLEKPGVELSFNVSVTLHSNVLRYTQMVREPWRAWEAWGRVVF